MPSTDTQLAELERLRTSVEITNGLLAAVSSLDPVHDLTSRMSVICQGSALIYDFEGRIVASTGLAPAQLIWNEVSATNRPELAFEVGRWVVRSRRVSLRDGVHVIVVASHSEERLDQIGELLIDTAERLLGAVHGIRYGAIRRDRRDNEQLLASLHDGVLPSREHRFWNRLTQFDFAAYSPVRAVEIGPFDASAARESQVEQLIASARSARLPLLIMLHRTDRDVPATIAALVPDSQPADEWITLVSASGLVGVSGPFTALGRTPESVREAETALTIGRQRAAVSTDPGRIGPIHIDRIDLATWLLSHVDAKQLGERVRRTLEPLSDDSLRETLVTFLAADQHIGRTAEHLFVHPNTVRYRLGRVEEAIGMSLASAAASANLVLALQAEIAGTQHQLATQVVEVETRSR